MNTPSVLLTRLIPEGFSHLPILPGPSFHQWLEHLIFRRTENLSFKVWNKDFFFLIWKLNTATVVPFVLQTATDCTYIQGCCSRLILPRGTWPEGPLPGVSGSQEDRILTHCSVLQTVGCDPLVGHKINLVIQDRHGLK